MKLLTLALATVGLGISCSDTHAPQDPNVGSIHIALSLPDGSTIDKVNYRITGPALPSPVLGAIPVAAKGATVSAQVLLPEGIGYSVELSAVTSSQTSCTATGSFSIVARQVTRLTLVLVCGQSDNNGTLIINGQVKNCPQITESSAQPLETSVGGTISLTSDATDADSDPLTYAWTATGGTFADPSAANTTWTCPSAGQFTLTLTVSDDVPSCAKSVAINVTCTGGSQPVLARTYKVTSHGLTAAQAESLKGAFSLSQLALDENGVARFADEKAFLALPTTQLPAPTPGEDHTGPLLAEGFDFAAIDKLPVLDPSAATDLAAKGLRQAGLDPANGIADATQTMFEATGRDGQTLAKHAIDTAVSYRFALGTAPLEGPGAKLRVAYDGNGKVTQLVVAMRGLEQSDEIPVVDKGEAAKRCATWNSPVGSTAGRVVDATLAYFAPPLTERIDTLSPSIRCATLGKGGGASQVFFVPAAVDAKPDPLPPPQPPRPLQVALAQPIPQIVSRIDVGSEGTGVCSGLPHTGQNLVAFNNGMSAAGVTVQFSWLDANAWEDDWKDPTLGGHDSTWVDNVDMAYWQGHGSPEGFWFSGCSSIDDNHLNHADALWGNLDAEWISLFTCLVLNGGTAGNYWWQRWGGAFNGLHQINSFDTVSYHSSVHGGIFANYIVRTPFLWWNNPMTIRQAWAQTAIDDQPSSVVWATMGSISSGGWVTWNDYFWGKGPVGPDIPKSQVTGWWRVWGGS